MEGMRTTENAWSTENDARERALFHLGGTLLGAVIYSIVASSCIDGALAGSPSVGMSELAPIDAPR